MMFGPLYGKAVIWTPKRSSFRIQVWHDKMPRVGPVSLMRLGYVNLAAFILAPAATPFYPRLRAMADQPPTIIGPVVEEPFSYDQTSPNLSRTTRHRNRRASSCTLMLERGGTLTQTSDFTTNFKAKSRSTASLPVPSHETISSTGSVPAPFDSPDYFRRPTGQIELQEIVNVEKTGESSTAIHVFPVTPQFMMGTRYKRTYFHPKRYDDGMRTTLKAVQTSFPSRRLEISNGTGFKWTPYESPEGNLYFRENEKNILTFVDLYNPSYLEGITQIVRDLLRRIAEAENIPPDTELAVMLRDDENETCFRYGYYLASWERRCVFWLEEVEYDLVTEETRVCSSETHIGKYIEFLFWYDIFRATCEWRLKACVLESWLTSVLEFTLLRMSTRVHVEMFPCHHGPPQDVLDDLKDQFNLGLYDQISSLSSLFPFDPTEAGNTLKCLERIKPDEQNAYSMWIVARCKQNMTEHAFLNFYGERGARIQRDDSVLEGKIARKRSTFFVMVSPFLFFMPSVYMEDLEHVWIDRTVDWITWRRFIDMLVRDWENSITPATVILSAAVGFLAIQSIDTESRSRSSAQILGYISAALALFYLIISQVLARHHRNSRQFGATKASEFLAGREARWLGLESVALTFSLPTALFIWSMLVFLAAMMVVFFWNTSIATRIVLGAVLILLSSITFSVLWLDWEGHNEYREESMVYRLCPRGLGTAVLGVKDKWKRRLELKFRHPSRPGSISSSTGSDSTAVGSPTQ